MPLLIYIQLMHSWSQEYILQFFFEVAKSKDTRVARNPQVGRTDSVTCKWVFRSKFSELARVCVRCDSCAWPTHNAEICTGAVLTLAAYFINLFQHRM